MIALLQWWNAGRAFEKVVIVDGSCIFPINRRHVVYYRYRTKSGKMKHGSAHRCNILNLETMVEVRREFLELDIPPWARDVMLRQMKMAEVKS